MPYRRSFVLQPRPFLCAIITEETPDAAAVAMRNAEYSGAQSFAVHACRMPNPYKDVGSFRAFLGGAGKPTLVMQYRDSLTESLSDDTRAEYLMRAIEAGACAVDIMGDFFSPAENELTRDEKAVDRQRRLIDRVHEAGAEVVMSSHTKTPMSTDRVLEHMTAMQHRGADMVKIVPLAQSEGDLLEAVQTTLALRKALKVPFIHLCNGRYGMVQRYIAPMLGSALSFGTYAFKPRGHCYQLPLSTLKPLFDHMYAHIDLTQIEGFGEATPSTAAPAQTGAEGDRTDAL